MTTEETARAAYEANTVGMRDEDGTTYTIASLRTAFDKYHAGDWKNPVNVTIAWESEMLVTFCRAIEFFQGDRPAVNAAVGGKFGMACITSRGYQG